MRKIKIIFVLSSLSNETYYTDKSTDSFLKSVSIFAVVSFQSASNRYIRLREDRYNNKNISSLTFHEIV